MKYFIDYKSECLKDQICPILNEASTVSTAFFPQCVSSLLEGGGGAGGAGGVDSSSDPVAHLPAKGTEVCVVWILNQ